MLELGAPQTKCLIGSGNAVRVDKCLQVVFEDVFGMKMQIQVHNEEVAFGSARYTMTAVGVCLMLEEVQKRISYQTI